MEQNIEEKTPRFDPKLWFKVFRHIAHEKKLIAITAISLVAVSLCDVAVPLMSKYALDNFVKNSTTHGLWLFIVVYAAIIIIESLGVLFFVKSGNNLELKLDYNLRQTMFLKLQNLSFSYYDRIPVGQITSRVLSDVANTSEQLIWNAIYIFMSLVYIVGTMISLFTLDAYLALCVVGIVPVLVIISDIFGKLMLKRQRKVRKFNSEITSSFSEGVMGAMTTKTLVREKQNDDEFFSLTGKMKKSSLHYATTKFIYMPLVIVIGSFGTAAVLLKGGIDVMNGLITFGTLSVFISSMSMFFESVQNVSEMFADLQSTQASAERVLELIDTPCEICDTPEVTEKYGDCFNQKTENYPAIKGDVEFYHVSFAYKNGEKVLDDFNLKVEAGKTIALVGETGAGKSTIINLICRFYEPTQGKILIDGVDIKQRSVAWLQSNLGYVLQSPHLFSGTIRDNIAFGRKDATNEEVIAAAKTVNAHSFIMTMKNGYDTKVGEGGSLLSTGQKQLISFARVVLCNPRLLILDEATSSIDTDTERQIQTAMTQVLMGRTAFVVAHRLSTIRNADNILVIKAGRIAESGTHTQLLEKGGIYHDLYMNQFREENSVKW